MDEFAEKIANKIIEDILRTLSDGMFDSQEEAEKFIQEFHCKLDERINFDAIKDDIMYIWEEDN